MMCTRLPLLAQLTLKRLVSTQQGARIASALIEAMMSHIMSHARHSAEALATDLQKGCPDFFGADSRTFYHARDLLQLARDARARKENVVRDKHVNDAIALFMKVPTAGDLSSVCAELVDLRAFHGVTAVPLAAAAALEARAEENRFAAGQSSVDMVVSNYLMRAPLARDSYGLSFRGEDKVCDVIAWLTAKASRDDSKFQNI